MITISSSNYLEAVKRGIIQERKLSGLIDGFLSNYFADLEDPSKAELLQRRSDLEDQRKGLQESLLKVSSELSIVSNKLDLKKQEKDQANKDEYDKIKVMNKSIKNSGLMDELVPL